MKKIIAFTLPLVILMSGCGNKEEKKEEALIARVSTAQSVEQLYHPVLVYSGTVQANKEANLGATLPGKIEKMYCSPGATVQKGTLLAELSGELLTQTIVEHDALQKDFDRISRLKDKGSVSQMEFDHLKARLDASDAKVEMMKKNTQVIAPFNGTIVDIFVHEGENFSLVPSIDAQNISINAGILKLMQLNPIKVNIEVSEKDLTKIKIGQTANVQLDAYPGKMITGKINYIKPVLSSSSRTATVEVELSNPGNLLKPGMYANVKIELPATNGVFIPVSSIFRQPGTSNDFIYTVVDGKARKLQIRQLQTQNEMVLVEGLSSGTQVVTIGKAKLSEGSVVEIHNK
ncbi:MAG: efflux RND transporter periplasmic adaptor subunit [Bacteroidales bacterium]|nr:efflux RND transporter periplasmic adaptor subunit [Bacteroidales bacterium]MDD4602392.1 efflux RND transporter periplasmic adaptor subunit [Bacteroidales bacterium]